MTMTHRAFFGDAERDFALAPELILELERLTGAGIGSLCKRLFIGQFHLTDISQVIRLALIGGGEHPQRSQELVSSYVSNRPLNESYPIAVAILEALWFGSAKAPVTTDDTVLGVTNG